ncbi:hypothetical protein HMSSN036_83460 [Paenibacillus macerans]|nr:hypothetical protein HMSSN036_83460 [Paenibacillus macerans]
MYSGTWMFTQIAEADPNFEFGFYALPDREGNVNVIGLSSPAGWSISTEASKDADKVEAIKQFIRFFFEPENYSLYLASINAIPSTKEQVTYESSEQMQVVLELMADPNVKNRWRSTTGGAKIKFRRSFATGTTSCFRNWSQKMESSWIT